MKILVADDDRVSRRLMERMLQRSGYEVITVDNGREAARILSSEDGPRLALIDWMMPELDGPGVCRAVRSSSETSYTYMLLLTAKHSNEDVVEGLRAGADDYLTKPCHPAELNARLHAGRRILQLEGKLVEAREEMRYRATRDSLTSLWNRGTILTLLQKELFRSIRENTSVSILLCDIDHFKQVNDVHGHPAGDEVLQEVSARLGDSFRPYDLVGRYGGEEFLIVLGGCGSEDLQKRADYVRERICERPCSTKYGELSVSMSIGATTIENWIPSLPIEPYLKLADEALYQAKALGRNQAVCAAPFAAGRQSLADVSPCEKSNGAISLVA